MDAILYETNEISRTAKSYGPGAPRLALSRQNDLPTTVARKPGHRGEYV